MKRILVLFLALGFALSTIIAQDKSVKADSTKQEVKKENCQMDCCCKKECKKGKGDMKDNCTKSKSKKEEPKK